MVSASTIHREPAQVSPGARRPAYAGAVALLAIATTYVSVSTVDVKLGSVPLKVFIVALAVAAWLYSSRPWTRPVSGFRFRYPVLAVAVLVPLLGVATAAYLSHQHDGAQRHGLGDAVQEASRFFYLLLYFPLADIQWLGSGWGRLWRWPALLVCAITIGLFVGHLAGVDYGNSGNVGPFQGAIAADATGTFRAFIVNDVLFLPLFAFMTANVVRNGLSVGRFAGLALVLLALYFAHTRGLWLGICAIIAVAIVGALQVRIDRRLMRATWVVLVAVGVGGLVISADPDVSHRLVNLVTGRAEFSTAERLNQAPQLLTGFRRHPVLGSGLGATLPSGFVRDRSVPWSFELTYLQLLFQVGIVGLALVLVPVLAAITTGFRRLQSARMPDRPLGYMIVAGLGGFLITAAGNPYLLTSVGTYALAVSLAILDRDLSAPNGDLRPSPPLARGWIAGLDHHLSRVGGRAALSITCTCALALTLLEFTRAHQALPPPSPLASVAFSKIAPHASLAPLTLGRGVAPLLHDQLAANPRYPSLIFAFSARSGIGVVTPLFIHGQMILRSKTIALGRAPEGRISFAVAPWGAKRQLAAFELVRQGARVGVRVVRLGLAPQLMTDAVSPPIPAPARTHRDLAVARVGRSATSLFVVDRYSDGRMAVHAYGGPNFSRLQLNVTLRYPSSFSPIRWQLYAGSVQTDGADLLLIGTDHVAAGSQLEALVLLGPSGYRRFGAQARLGIPAGRLGSLQFLPTGATPLPLLYMVDATHRSIDVLRLG